VRMGRLELSTVLFGENLQTTNNHHRPRKTRSTRFYSFSDSVCGGLKQALELPIYCPFSSTMFCDKLEPFTMDPFTLLALLAQHLNIEPLGLECLAKTVYFETRGEPARGQIAVANVVLNRATAIDHPDAISEVVQERRSKRKYDCEFSWACDGKSDRPKDLDSYARSVAIAGYAMAGQYKRGAEIYYHAEYVPPGWPYQLVGKIGRHIFYR